MATIDGYPIPLDPIRQWRGDPLTLVLRLTVPADPPTDPPVPVDLSGYGTGWTSQLRRSATSAGHVDFTVDVTKIADPTDPRLTLSLTGTQTTAMTASGYGFDVQATGGGQTPFTVWQGKLVMAGEYTHA